MRTGRKSVGRIGVLLALSWLALGHTTHGSAHGGAPGEGDICPVEYELCWEEVCHGQGQLVAWADPQDAVDAIYVAAWSSEPGSDSDHPQHDGLQRHYHWRVVMGEFLHTALESARPWIHEGGMPLVLPFSRSSSSRSGFSAAAAGDDPGPGPDPKAPVPEPGAALLFALGAGLTAHSLRR